MGRKPKRRQRKSKSQSSMNSVAGEAISQVAKFSQPAKFFSSAPFLSSTFCFSFPLVFDLQL